MNAKQKGWRTVRKGREVLHQMGYITDTVEKTSRFAKQKDCFKLWDVLALKPRTLIFIQFTTTKPHTHKPFQQFANEYGTDQLWFEQWVWIKYTGFKRYKYYPTNYYNTEMIP